MRARPRVREVGAVSAMPFIEANINMATTIAVDGRPTAEGEGAQRIPRRRHARLLFGDAHRPARRPPLRLARLGAWARRWPSSAKAWPDGWRQEAASSGRRFATAIRVRMSPAEVVGVVADIRHDGLDRPARLEMFVPHAQVPFGSMTFVARIDGDPGAAIPDLKAQIHAVDPAQAIYRAATAEELVSKSLIERRFMLSLLAGFALVAGLLAAIGIYGVISVATKQRTQRVRPADGARRGARRNSRMVLVEGAKHVDRGAAARSGWGDRARPPDGTIPLRSQTRRSRSRSPRSWRPSASSP